MNPAGTQVAADSVERVRRRHGESPGPELDAVTGVVLPRPGRPDRLALGHEGQSPDHGGGLETAPNPHPQYRESVLRVVEDDPLDDARERFPVLGRIAQGC